MKKKTILLPTKKFFKSDEEDLSITLKLEDNSKLLREGDRDIVLDINQLFNEERNKSNQYKIYGKLKMIFRNMYTGVTNYEPLLRHLYVPNENNLYSGNIPYNEFAFLRNDTLREVNYVSTGQTITLGLTGIEYTGHTVTTNFTAPYKNWNLYLSYVYGQNENYPMKYTLTGGTFLPFVSGDGIPFRVEKTGNTYKLTSPVEHGMNPGEYIIIGDSNVTLTGVTSGRTFSIISVGDETYNSENYVLEIFYITGATMPDISNRIIVGKRCLDIGNITGTTSTYYVHNHKIISGIGDYIIDNAGFESPIWENEQKLLFENALGEPDVLVEKNRMESLLFDFKNPIILSGITNNLGYTPTEVYVSVFLRNQNGYFNYPPKVGYKFNFHDTWIDNHFSGTTSNETKLTSTPFNSNTNLILNPSNNHCDLFGSALKVTTSCELNGVAILSSPFSGGTEVISGTTGFTGAFIEYNQNEMKERVISEAYHKIVFRRDIFDHGQTDSANFSGATVNNPFGLYYQPYYRVKLRQLSPYIETSDTEEIDNLPENVRYDENEKLWKWHDLYDHGYIDPEGYGTNFPFTNDTHYVKNDINFYLRNEQLYTNKADGINKFKNTKLKRYC